MPNILFFGVTMPNIVHYIEIMCLNTRNVKKKGQHIFVLNCDYRSKKKKVKEANSPKINKTSCLM